MNKVMTRTVRHTPSRPPVRRDTRRPGSAPHRTPPGGGTPRTPLPEATTPRAYDELAWLAARGPLRTRGARPVVRDVGYFEPSRGALEAFARIGAGDQLRAMAFRLELGRDFRWRCTAVELGGPRRPHTADD
ncbi:MAG: hypothetical protein JF621_18155 [Streptomyces turgidiscabies]|nr:hypothetical protein [Streptomyces turgidiscabies]